MHTTHDFIITFCECYKVLIAFSFLLSYEKRVVSDLVQGFMNFYRNSPLEL